LPITEPAIVASRERFVATWATMGAHWGIPRTMAEVHALLFIAGDPMTADDVMDQLGISRGNASMTIRSLVDWGIVHRVRLRGERKDYFQAEQDVWKLFRIILRERKKRELEPLLDSVRACRDLTRKPEDARSRRKVDPQTAQVEAHNARLDSLIEFLTMIDLISNQLVSPSGEGLDIAAKLLERSA
jgi:HTH-type transcriptional regulator, glycine betaine synthesis regulator